MDGGSVDNAGAIIDQSIPGHRRYGLPVLSRLTTAMDGGSVDNAGAIIDQSIPLDIVATDSLSSRDIQSIPGHRRYGLPVLSRHTVHPWT